MKLTLLHAILPTLTILSACDFGRETVSLTTVLGDVEQMAGAADYLGTPFVAAGDRVYMIGHQDGTFPDLGWHVEGEMGGIWAHPIKLMDGFTMHLTDLDSETALCLDSAGQFVNYPFANKHIYTRGDLTIERTQFAPDSLEGLVVEYLIRNNGSDTKDLRVSFTAMVDLRPVWLAERQNITDGPDSLYLQELTETYLAQDSTNNWSTVFGSSEEINRYLINENPCPQNRKGRGTNGTLVSRVTIEPGQARPVQYYIAGSSQSADQAQATYALLKEENIALLQKKKERYQRLMQASSISIPDKDIETMYRWMKYNTDWLIRDVPAIGRGVSAGLPDYPWWFGADNCYTLQGLLATGSHGEVLSTIHLLEKLSQEVNGNGRIIHETSTNGETYNPGNLNETPQFIHLLWLAYQWTGNRELLDRYFPEVEKGIDWLAQQDKNGNGYPDGPGMMEIHGLHTEMVDVVAYTQQALASAALMAAEVGEGSLAEAWAKKAEELRAKINTEWWVSDFNSFADFRATKAEAIELIDAAIVRADTINKPWAIVELEATKRKLLAGSQAGVKGHVVHHNWVVNTPMETGAADAEKAGLALQTAGKYTNRFGMYVTGMDRDEGSDASSKWKAFSYVGAVMTLPTGVQAVAEANYGHPDKALAYLKNLYNSFGYALPGSMYEVSPDYGMVVQAWNIYAVAVPIVNHFFGIKPEAHKNRVVIAPDMPAGWDNVAISEVKVGNNLIGYEKATGPNEVTFTLSQADETWELVLIVPVAETARVTVNGDDVAPEITDGMMTLALTGSSNQVKISLDGN